MTNVSKFEEEMKQFVKKVEVETEDMTKSTAKAAFRIITFWAPVLTGSFVKSNRVGIGTVDPEIINIPEEMALSMQAAKTQSLQQQIPKIDLFKLKDGSIFISNNVGHAVNVEFGWPTKIGYAPYRMAYEVIRAGIA